PGEAETYQCGGRFFQRVGEGDLRGLLAVLARDVEDVRDLDPVLVERLPRGQVERLGERFPRDAGDVVRVRGDLQLGVAPALPGQVPGQPGDQGGDVLRLADQCVDRPVHLGE